MKDGDVATECLNVELLYVALWMLDKYLLEQNNTVFNPTRRCG